MTQAVVVGSGPNGLAAAFVLAEAGIQVHVVEAADRLGGGARNSSPLVPGLVQDHCAAVHPMAAASPHLLGLHLTGVDWLTADVDCAHPLDTGDAVLLRRSIDSTSDGLGRDGRRWRMLFGASSRAFGRLADDILSPLVGVPSHPLLLARFGMVAALPPTLVSRVFRDERTRALYLGIAAHALQPLSLPLIGGIGAGIITAGHAVGWPVVRGGTGALTDAVLDRLRDLGVTFETGRRIRQRSDLPQHDIAMFDLHPHAVADILGEEMPGRLRSAFQAFRPGPAAFKVEFAVEGGVPWRATEATRAGTLHLGGTAAEIVQSERDVTAGRMPARPFVLVGQQAVADPSRAVGSVQPVYAYAHVPSGYSGDATPQIIAQFERFAPGFRERIIASRATTPLEFSRDNANFVAGDILTGAKTPSQFALGTRLTRHPYDTGTAGAYICSAATPPGPGIHGMCGVNAARRALQDLS